MANNRKLWTGTNTLYQRMDKELREKHPEIVLSAREVWNIYTRHTPIDKKVDAYDINYAIKLILENPAAKEELETRNEAEKAKQR